MYKLSKILCLFSIVAILLMLQAQNSLGESSEDSEVICKEAIKLFMKGEIAEAEKKFNSALKTSKYNAESYYYLALIYSIYATDSEDIENEKKQMINKACSYLKNAVSAGYRDYKSIFKESRFDVLRDVPEYEETINTLIYLAFKESNWVETKSFESSVTFPENLDLKKKYPLLIYLKNREGDEAEKFEPEKYPANSEMICAVVHYSVNEFDVNGGMWSEFTEKRVRKTFEEIKEKNENRMYIDFTRVYVCGVRQSGYRALMAYLEYSDVFTGAIFFNAPIYKDSEVYKLLDAHENKETLRIIAVQSKKDTLSFKKNNESWITLKNAGIPVDYRVEEDFIFGLAIEKYEKDIFEFINKELPKPEKTEDGLQTKEGESEESDESDETEETPDTPDNTETPETPEEPEKDNPNE